MRAPLATLTLAGSMIAGLSLGLAGCDRQPSVSAKGDSALLSPIDRATLFCPGGGWILEFFPNGSVRAQYGALPGDEGELPPGSVDFSAVVEEIERQQADGPGASQAALHRRGESTSYAFSLRNESYFRGLIERADGKWIPGERFAELRRQYPMFPPPRQP